MAAVEEVQQILSERQALQARNAQLQQEVEHLKHQLDWFKKQLFGQKSERREGLPAEQLSLGEALQIDVASTPMQTVKAYTRAKGKQPWDQAVEETGLRFDEKVPVKEIRLPNPEIEGLDPSQYEIIGEKITHRLAQSPSAYVVLKYIRTVIKRADTQRISYPSAPAAVLEKSYADVSLLAGILVDKFVSHLPLYRQHQRAQSSGIRLSRATFTHYTHSAIALLEPIVQAQWQSILEGRTLALDETPIKAGVKEKRKLGTGYFWPAMGERNEIVFHYQPTRAQVVVKGLLQGYCGVLLTDGYAAYEHFVEQTEGIVHAQCWAHTRRKFIEAEKVEPDRVAQGLQYVRALYTIEERIRQQGLDPPAIVEERTRHSQPLVHDFFDWVDTQLLETALLQKNPFVKACAYALHRKKALSVFLTDPGVAIDTNHLERSLRPIPMGRKNWLFCWTEVGAKYVGIIQSLLVTCRLQGVDPYTYLVDVLQRIDQHPMSKAHELTPRLWKEKFAASPLRSDLHSGV